MPYSSWRLARPPGKNRGACVSHLLLQVHQDLTLPPTWACGFVELTSRQGSTLPGPELPQAWVSLAESRGPGWDDGREWVQAVIRFLRPTPTPTGQQSQETMSLYPMEG